jgi:hypothetical protein
MGVEEIESRYLPAGRQVLKPAHRLWCTYVHLSTKFPRKGQQRSLPAFEATTDDPQETSIVKYAFQEETTAHAFTPRHPLAPQPYRHCRCFHEYRRASEFLVVAVEPLFGQQLIGILHAHAASAPLWFGRLEPFAPDDAAPASQFRRIEPLGTADAASLRLRTIHGFTPPDAPTLWLSTIPVLSAYDASATLRIARECRFLRNEAASSLRLRRLEPIATDDATASQRFCRKRPFSRDAAQTFASSSRRVFKLGLWDFVQLHGRTRITNRHLLQPRVRRAASVQAAALKKSARES